MIFLTWALYFAVLYLVFYGRVMAAGMGIYLDMLPTFLIHGLVFMLCYQAVRLLRKLVFRGRLTQRKTENNPPLIFGVVTVGFTTMYALNSYGFLSRAMTGYLVPICAYIVLAVSLNLVVGISGELSLGHAGFMGLGAFTGIVVAAFLKDTVANDLLRLAIAMFSGGLVAGLAGLVIGIPVLRLRGDYLAIVTLAFGEILKNIISNLYVGLDQNGLQIAMNSKGVKLEEGGKMIIDGPMGAVGVKQFTPLVKEISLAVGFVLIIFTLFVVLNFINSKEGRAAKAVRDNRIAAESVGINVTAFRLKTFVMSAFLAGMAGTLYGLNLGSLQASKFSYNTSIDILVFVVLGGMGNILGSIISTVVLYLVPEFLRSLADYRMIMYAVVLIVVMLFTWSPKFKSLVQVVRSAVADKLRPLFAKLKKSKKEGGGQ